MEVTMNETSQMVAQSVRDFAGLHIEPYRREWDDKQIFPLSVLKELGNMGLMGVLVPEEFGGAGLGYHEYVAAIAELAKADPGIALSMAAHNSLCTGHIMLFGNEAQKRRWLPKLATAEWLGAWALTEPNTGSDAVNMRTVAHQDGDHWVLNGAKNFITHGKSGHVAVVIARTGERRDSHGMTAFVIEKGTNGFYAGRKEDKLGMRTSETTELIFDNCVVHQDNILGEVGDGFIQAMKVLEGGRISIAALSLGIAEGALQHAIDYAKERHQFDKPIASFQGISFKIAQLATELEAAKLMVHKAAELKNQGQKVNMESAMAKYFASELAVKAANEAVQIFGGYGFVKDYPVEKYYRDCKLCTIGEGTSEIQKLVITRELMKK